MALDLKSWKRDWTLMSVFFNGEEISSITERLKKLQTGTIAFCSYENRFARSGGLAAVTTRILPYLKEVNRVPRVVLLTPFHSEIISESSLNNTGVSFPVTVNSKTAVVKVYEYTWNYMQPAQGSLKEFYLQADGFFNARNKLGDPYTHDPDDPDRNAALQSENALFFCKAAPLALSALGIKEDIVFHLQEWQTSLIALTAKEAMLTGTLLSCGTVQTMHNSYDSPVTRAQLAGLVDGPRRQKMLGLPDEGLSAYRVALQLVDGPITTVSRHFADELTSDIIQTGHYAPHLQRIMNSGGVWGVNNGMFVDLDPGYPRGEGHTIDEVKAIKIKNRKALLRILSSYRPPERFGDLTFRGRTISRLPDSIPIVVMSGRLDPIQKGFFVFLRALETFAPDEIKAIVTPLPVNPDDLDYFYEVACKCKGNITVFPVRMHKGFRELQTGATFGIMPSIYEPFGAAVEYMASGTVNIARATGGLVDQIDSSCGFLFREDAVFYTPEHMRDYVDTSHIIQVRKTNPWAQSMADSLSQALRRASALYQNSPDEYYGMVLNGFRKVKQFTWEESAKRYFQTYSMISAS